MGQLPSEREMEEPQQIKRGGTTESRHPRPPRTPRGQILTFPEHHPELALQCHLPRPFLKLTTACNIRIIQALSELTTPFPN